MPVAPDHDQSRRDLLDTVDHHRSRVVLSLPKAAEMGWARPDPTSSNPGPQRTIRQFGFLFLAFPRLFSALPGQSIRPLLWVLVVGAVVRVEVVDVLLVPVWA
jgi:hypothetical protein